MRVFNLAKYIRMIKQGYEATFIEPVLEGVLAGERFSTGPYHAILGCTNTTRAREGGRGRKRREKKRGGRKGEGCLNKP